MQIIRWQEMASGSNPHGVVVKKLLEYEHASVVIIDLHKGESLKTHITPVDVFFFIIEGSGNVSIGDETQPVKAQDLIFSPKNIPHALANPDADHFRFLVVKTPKPTEATKILF